MISCFQQASNHDIYNPLIPFTKLVIKQLNNRYRIVITEMSKEAITIAFI